MASVWVHEIGAELCEALGLPPEDVTRINFDWRVGDMAKIDVAFLVQKDGEMATIFKKYELHEKESEAT